MGRQLKLKKWLPDSSYRLRDFSGLGAITGSAIRLFSLLPKEMAVMHVIDFGPPFAILMPCFPQPS